MSNVNFLEKRLNGTSNQLNGPLFQRNVPFSGNMSGKSPLIRSYKKEYGDVNKKKYPF